MASEGASGEQQPPPPVQTLSTAVLGTVDNTKCEFNMDNLSKPELLTLLSIMEGELEARDLVIEALRAQRKEVFLQERYGHYSLTDPFLALQRDVEAGGEKERRPLGSSPISVLEAVMSHCRKMQERMSAQLAAAERREKRLEMEKLQLQSLEQDHRKLTAQLKDEREKNKHIVMMLVRECKQLATRVVEESQRFDELQARMEEEGRSTGRLQEELSSERQRSQQMEAKMEKQLSEFDTEREQLRARLGREEAEGHTLRQQLHQLQTEQDASAAAANAKAEATAANAKAEATAANAKAEATAANAKAEATAAASPTPKAVTSVSVATEPVSSRTASSQTDLPPTEPEGPKKTPLTIPVKPSPAAHYVGLSLPKTGRGLVHSSSGGLAQTENGSEGAAPHSGVPSGVSPRVQAARYKFQEQDQNGTSSQSPPARDLSPSPVPRDNFAAKQQARHTVTQVLSRFTSPPAGGRPGLPHSASEGGPFPGRLSHPIGIKSPTVARIDRGNPPPIPPKKPGLSQTPSPPHPPMKGDSGRSKPATPTLPPKPALELVPALAASQVGALPAGGRGADRQPAACAECPPVISSPPSIHPPSTSPVSAPSSRSNRASAGSPLATASGWGPSVASYPSGGGLPAGSLDSRSPPLMPQAASQGNVTLLSMLLNQPDPTTKTTTTTNINTTTASPTTATSSTAATTSQHYNDEPIQLDHEPPHLQPYHHHYTTSALFAAAQNGHAECVKLLLSSGCPADVSDENGFTPSHFAAAHGHSSCVAVLLSGGAPVDLCASGGQTALHLASEAGQRDCVLLLLNAGADRSRSTNDGCTPLHAAVRSGHVDTLRLLLCHGTQCEDPTDSRSSLALSAALLNQANNDGWTAAHMAAALGLKECLEVLCGHSEQDIERRDKCNRTIHDVATDDCKDLLENLHQYRVLVRLQSGVFSASLCPVEALHEEDQPPTTSTNSQSVCGGDRAIRWSHVGRVRVDRSTCWTQLGSAIHQAFSSYLHTVCGDAHTDREETAKLPLGLGPNSIASVLIGDTEWLPGQELALSPWDLVRKPLSQTITIRLKGLSESCLDESALEYLLPLPLLHNYVRLVEQYGNLIFHGLEGSFQDDIANLVARCIKCKHAALGLDCEVVRVDVDQSLTKEQLLDAFITCGFLVPACDSAAPSPGCAAPSPGCAAPSPGCVVVLLSGLEKASSLSALIGDLCHCLDNRGTVATLSLNTGPHHFAEGSFLIGSLAKPRLPGSELRLQQHFRWVTLRWDQEPLQGMLGRHLRRKLLHKTSAEGPLEACVLWVSRVWLQLNACLTRLGTHEALIGPQLFLSCPVIPHNTQAVVRWLSRLWNAVVVPRVEEAIISRVTAKRPISSSSSFSSSQRRSPSDCVLSPGQTAVVKAALSILLNKAVLQGCPLPRHEIDVYLLEFGGGSFPLSALGSGVGGRGGVGGRKARDGAKLRRSNTSPRKKGNAGLTWSSGGSFREGSLSSTDVSFISNGNVQREPVGLSVFSDDETDLIKELQTMCSSKSEPDISKISRAKDDLILFSSSPSEATPTHNAEQQTASQQRTQTTSVRQASVPSSDRRSSRSKSHLPVPSSSRGGGPQQTHTRPPAVTTGNNNNATMTTPPPSLRGNHHRSTNSSSRTKQAPPPNNNYYSNNINHSQSNVEDIWILHRDMHGSENDNSK